MNIPHIFTLIFVRKTFSFSHWYKLLQYLPQNFLWSYHCVDVAFRWQSSSHLVALVVVILTAAPTVATACCCTFLLARMCHPLSIFPPNRHSNPFLFFLAPLSPSSGIAVNENCDFTWRNWVAALVSVFRTLLFHRLWCCLCSCCYTRPFHCLLPSLFFVMRENCSFCIYLLAAAAIYWSPFFAPIFPACFLSFRLSLHIFFFFFWLAADTKSVYRGESRGERRGNLSAENFHTIYSIPVNYSVVE